MKPLTPATLRDTVQCSLGPVQGAVSALWEYSQSHLNTNAFVKYSNHSLGKEDAVLKVSKLSGSLSQPVHCIAAYIMLRNDIREWIWCE